MKDEPNPSTEQTQKRLHWLLSAHVKRYPLRKWKSLSSESAQA